MTAFANASLHLVNYPVKVTVKSFKLIPTMFVATQLLRKKYDRWQYAAAALLCLGLAQFLLSDRRTSTRPSSPLGLFFLVVSCCVDAFAPVLQDQAMNKLESSPLFVMSFVSCFLVFFLCLFFGVPRVRWTVALLSLMIFFFFSSSWSQTNSVASCVMVVLLMLTGEMVAVVPYFYTHPMVLFFVVMYATSTFLGIYSYMLMVKEVGGVGTALVSTVRKVATVVLSFILQGRVFSWGYAVGGGMIVASVMLDKVVKARMKRRSGSGGSHESNERGGRGGRVGRDHKSDKIEIDAMHIEVVA